MENIKDIIALVGVFGVPIAILTIPVVAILTKHQQRLAEIKANGVRGTDDALRQEVENLRAEFAALRDTTTRFNLSFDTQLTRVEERVDKMQDERIRTSYDTTSLESPEQAAMRMRH